MRTKQQIDTNNAISICFRPFILAICENIVRTRSSLRNSDQFTIRWLHKLRRQNWCRLTAFQQRTKKHQQNWQFDKLETFFWSNFRFYREKKNMVAAFVCVSVFWTGHSMKHSENVAVDCLCLFFRNFLRLLLLSVGSEILNCIRWY